MTIENLDLDDAQEPIVVEADEEYKLRIVSVKVDTDKNDLPYCLPTLEVVNEPYAKEFTHFLRLPDDQLSEKELNRAKYNLKMFLEAFELPTKGRMNFEEDLLGAEGWAILGMKDDPNYGEQNYIKKLVTSK